MAMEKNVCKRCLLRDTLDKEEYERTVARVWRAMKESVRTPQPLYEERLALCSACDQLQNGTCMLCGCMVEMRAMRRDAHCPTPRKRW